MNACAILLFSLLSFITGSAQPGKPVSAELIFVGDAMQHQAQLDQAKSEGEFNYYDYSGCFNLIAPTITAADYAVCNLEVPLGGGPDYSGYPCFSAPDSFAKALYDAGFDLMLTANNHCLDRRDKGARNTLKALDRMGIDHIGTYDTALQRDSLVPFITDIKGIKFAFLNYTYGTNGIEPREGIEVATIDRKKISEEIDRARAAGAEMVVVTMHWGVEYVLLENEQQRSLADFLVEKDVDLVIGAHPHVIQPMKIVRNPKTGKEILVVYSLGNFISNMKTADTRGGALVKVMIERDAEGKPRIKNAVYDTLFAAKPYGKGTNFQVIPSWMPEKIPSAQKAHWELFERGAKKIFDTHNIGVEKWH